ncbi:hypothetical protein ScPMuIL_018536 [Solemya velum]
MAESYGSILPTRAIYHSSSTPSYIAFLSASKFFRAVGLFLSYDLLKLIPVVQFLYIVKAGSALVLIFLQRPFSSGKKISKNQWFRIGRHAFFGGIIHLLWFFGLTLCGPLRTILLFEHSDLVVIAWISVLFTSAGGGPAKMRGAVFFLSAVVVLVLLDHDEGLDHMTHKEHADNKHHTIFTHLFYHLVNFVGWSDHKGGVVLLFLTSCLQAGYSHASRKLSVDIGGAKRLQALSTMVEALLVAPWASYIYLTRESNIESWLFMLFPLFLVIFFVFVMDFYVESVVHNHVQSNLVALYSAVAIFVSALFLSLTWNHPLMAKITTMHKLKEVITEDHVLSGGVTFGLLAFLLATYMLTWPSKSAKGSFIGYSPAGLPLYSFTGEALQRTSHSIMAVLTTGMKHIVEDENSRTIFYFLCINLSFTFVELVYGVWTNSLGLISDGFHMLFDCSALVMGLYAAVMSKWKATRVFSYGFDRVEVLSGFINGLFLVVIGVFVFTEALTRLFDPPDINTDRLFIVSVLGLLVNLIGIFAFKSHSHGHSHGGHSHDQSPAKGHGHSHGGHGHSHGGHGHSHGGHGHSHGGHDQSDGHHNTNMEGVFLHILADTLGSVGVIISSVLIENFGWNISDPICTLFIATLILLSVFPLLKETAVILLLRTPLDNEKEIEEALDKLMSIEGVLAYREPHFWSHTGDKFKGTIHIQVAPDCSEQKIISLATSILKESGLQELMIQVEKATYFHHLSGISIHYNDMTQFAQNFQALKFEDKSTTVTSL